MTEPTQQPEAEATPPPELPIPFMGREIWVRMPTPEQLLVWQRTVNNLTNAPVDASWTGPEVMAALDRLRRIVDSILVNRADITWLDDQFLDGTIGFKELTPLVTDATSAFTTLAAENAPNREARRAAGKPAKKAARKAAKR